MPLELVGEWKQEAISAPDRPEDEDVVLPPPPPTEPPLELFKLKNLGSEKFSYNDAKLWNTLESMEEASTDLLAIAEFCEKNYALPIASARSGGCTKSFSDSSSSLNFSEDETFPEAPSVSSNPSQSSKTKEEVDKYSGPILFGESNFVQTGEYLCQALNSVAMGVSTISDCIIFKMDSLASDVEGLNVETNYLMRMSKMLEEHRSRNKISKLTTRKLEMERNPKMIAREKVMADPIALRRFPKINYDVLDAVGHGCSHEKRQENSKNTQFAGKEPEPSVEKSKSTHSATIDRRAVYKRRDSTVGGGTSSTSTIRFPKLPAQLQRRESEASWTFSTGPTTSTSSLSIKSEPSDDGNH